MEVATVCHRYFPHIGGVETQVEDISTRLVQKGWLINVLTTDPSGRLPREEVIRGVRVERFKSWAPYEAYYFSRSLKKYLDKNSGKFDIVHAHGYHSFPALYAAQAKGRNKLVFTPHYHGSGHTVIRSLLHGPYRFLGAKIFDKADMIVCVSNYEKGLIFKHFKVDERKVAIVPNGINLDEFKCLKKKSKDHKKILYVGRLEEYKGAQHLIKILPALDDDVFLEIVGKGPYEETLKRLRRKLGLEGRVNFFHDLPRNELLQKYVNADVFVLLSGREAFGISVAEALASGTPCVLANTSALTEWIDGENCFGVNYPIELEELATVIVSAMGRDVHPPKLWDCEEVAEIVAGIYSSVLST